MRTIFILFLVLFTNINILAHDKIYKGLYHYGVEVHNFTPCKQKQDYWVTYNWAGIKMNDFYKKNKNKPYQSMYLEFRGQILNEEVNGFASDYDGLIHISEVKKFSFKIPKKCK